jgi:hypothetical protein
VWWTRLEGDLGFESVPGTDEELAIAVLQGGDAIVAGHHRGPELGIGGAAVDAKGPRDVFVARLDARTGQARWLRSFGGEGRLETGGLAIGSGDEIVITGMLETDVDFGEGRLSSAGEWDVFAASLSAGGELRWAHLFGGEATESSPGVATAPDATIVVTAAFVPPLSVSGVALPAQAAPAGFVLELRP